MILETTAAKTDEPKAAETSPPQQAAPAPATGVQIRLNESKLVSSCANFCRISSTPEELILDMGLNTQPMSPETQNVELTQRVILNHYTAKRLLNTLLTALQCHEPAFGALETDVRRRVQPR